ncbi:hypothetical protein [Cereibacter sphaeroides]|uniref:hypothetical protein n=1 Tax=Cereibacter sphaeroides TaxID=1063 RepID=UPI0009E229C9|nr:hypothetical protein [Cereibacter sphaeroides]
MEDKSRVAAKKALMRLCTFQVAAGMLKKAESMPADPVVYRIDLKVPDSLKAAITTVEGANRPVPAGTA